VSIRTIDQNTGHLLIDISDTGIGIPPEKIDTLFDAFTQADGSTTRKYGGTGLGLSIVKRLCELMGGTVKATSIPNQGSTFSVEIAIGFGTHHEQTITSTVPIIDGNETINASNILWPESTRILLVEDNTTNQLVAQGMLENIGLRADIAANGLEALEALQLAHQESAPYTIILMDCQMPEMDGYTASSAIRAGKTGDSNSKIPIVAMTANAMSGDKEKCILSGMDDYISKPINQSILKATLMKWLLNDTSIQSPNMENPITHSTPKQLSYDELPLWDEVDALHRLGGNNALMRKIIESFMNDGPKSLALLSKALEDNNTQDAQLHAHSLKGSAGNVGALKLQNFSKHLEDAAKDNNLSEVQAGFEECKNILDGTLELFKHHLAKDIKPATHKKHLDPLQIAVKLQELKKELEQGTFIDTDEVGIFVEYTDEAFTQKMTTLKDYLNSFETDKAINLIDKTMLELE
jgi:CheY-like chemotaxis protein